MKTTREQATTNQLLKKKKLVDREQATWIKEFDELRTTSMEEDSVVVISNQDAETVKDFIEHLLEKEEGKHIKIYRWLCGYFDFPIREEGDGAYYWRSHLRNKLKKIGISTLRNSKGGKQK